VNVGKLHYSLCGRTQGSTPCPPYTLYQLEDFKGLYGYYVRWSYIINKNTIKIVKIIIKLIRKLFAGVAGIILLLIAFIGILGVLAVLAGVLPVAGLLVGIYRGGRWLYRRIKRAYLSAFGIYVEY